MGSKERDPIPLFPLGAIPPLASPPPPMKPAAMVDDAMEGGIGMGSGIVTLAVTATLGIADEGLVMGGLPFILLLLLLFWSLSLW